MQVDFEFKKTKEGRKNNKMNENSEFFISKKSVFLELKVVLNFYFQIKTSFTFAKTNEKLNFL